MRRLILVGVSLMCLMGCTHHINPNAHQLKVAPSSNTCSGNTDCCCVPAADGSMVCSDCKVITQ